MRIDVTLEHPAFWGSALGVLLLLLLLIRFFRRRRGEPEYARQVRRFIKRRDYRKAGELQLRHGHVQQAYDLFVRGDVHDRAADCAERLQHFDWAANHAELAGNTARAIELYLKAADLTNAARLYGQMGQYRTAAETLAKELRAPPSELARLWENALLDMVPSEGEAITGSELEALRVAAQHTADAYLRAGDRARAAHFYEIGGRAGAAEQIRKRVPAAEMAQLDLARDRILERIGLSVEAAVTRSGAHSVVRLMDDGAQTNRPAPAAVPAPLHKAGAPSPPRPPASTVREASVPTPAAPRRPPAPSEQEPVGAGVAGILDTSPAHRPVVTVVDQEKSRPDLPTSAPQREPAPAVGPRLPSAKPAPAGAAPKEAARGASKPTSTDESLGAAWTPDDVAAVNGAIEQPGSYAEELDTEGPVGIELPGPSPPAGKDDTLFIADPTARRVSEVRRRSKRYRLLDRIGQGGLGVVYAAHDAVLQREVALKFLPVSLVANPELLAMFKEDAQAVAKLKHPHICAVHDFGVMDGRPYVCMELLEGETVDALLSRRGNESLPVLEVLDIAEGLLSALEHAHARGVIHLDVRPANIMRTAQGTIKLMDFGLAKLADPAVTTHASAAPSYIAPEQMVGRPVSRRTDLFAAGVAMYRLLTGKAPFEGLRRDTTPASMREYSRAIPKPLDELILSCLDPDPDRRPTSAEPLLQAVRFMRRQVQVYMEWERGSDTSTTRRAVTEASKRKDLPDEIEALLRDYLRNRR